LATERDQHEKARSFFERGLALRRRFGLGSEAELRQLGVLASRQGEHEQAREYFVRARDESRRSGNVRAEHGAMVSLANAAITEGDLQTALETYRDLLAGSHGRIGDWERAVLYGNCSYVGHHIGILEESLDFANRAQAVAEGAGLLREVARGKINGGRALHLAGRFEEAQDRLEAAVRETRELSAPFYQTFALSYLISTLLDAPGDPRWPELEELSAESLRIAEGAGLRHAEITGSSLAARVKLGTGDIAGALQRSLRALRLLEESSAIECQEEEILHAHAVILRAAGRAADARVFRDRALGVIRSKASRMRDPALRGAFLTRIPVNVAIQRFSTEPPPPPRG
jgi:tetratricopeptide (TPR) repeat protein